MADKVTLAEFRARLNSDEFKRGAEDIKRSSKEVTAAVDKIGESTTKAGKNASLSSEGFHKFWGSIDQNVARARQYQNDLDKLNRFQQAGVVTSGQYVVAQDAIRRKYADLIGVQDQATRGTANFSSALGAARGVLGAFGIALSIGSFVHWIKNVSDSASRIADMSEALKTSTAFISGWEAAAGKAGVAAQKADQALERLNDKFGDAARGSTEARKSFALLGVDVDKLAKDEAGLERIAAEVNEGIRRQGNAFIGASLAQDIYGRGIGKMLPILRDGKDGIDRIVKSTDEFGAASSRNITAVDQWGDRVTANMIRVRNAAMDALGWLLRVTEASANSPAARQQAAMGGLDPRTGYTLNPATPAVPISGLTRALDRGGPLTDAFVQVTPGAFGSMHIAQFEAQKAARDKAIEDAKRALEKAADDLAAFSRKAGEDALKQLETMTAGILKSQQDAGETAIAALRAYTTATARAGVDAVNDFDEANRRAAEHVSNYWRDVSFDMADSFRSMFDRIFIDGDFSFKKLSQSFRAVFGRIASDQAAIALGLGPALGIPSGVGGRGFGGVGASLGLSPGQTGLLGAAGLGALGGGLLASLTGGSQLGGTLGGGIGATAGMFFGGPIGGVIGGLAGSAIGGLFGGSKPSDYTAFANFGADWSTGGGLAGDKPNQQTLAAAQQAGQAIAQAAQMLEKAGIDLANNVTRLRIGQRDPSKLQLTGGGFVNVGAAGDVQAAVKGTLDYLLGGATSGNADVQSVIDRYRGSGGVTTENIDQLLADIDFAKTLQDLDWVEKKLTQSEQVLKSITDQFDVAIARAKELGLETVKIEEARARAIADLVQSVNQSTQDAIDALVNPTFAAWNALAKAQEERLKEAKSLGADVALLERRSLLERQSFLRELNDEQRAALVGLVSLAVDMQVQIARMQQAVLAAISEQMGAASRFASEMRSLARSYEQSSGSLAQARNAFLVGDLSPLSPMGQYRESRTQLEAMRGLAVGGNLDALRDIPNLAQGFLRHSLNVNAATPAYGADFTYAQSVIDQAKSASDRFGADANSAVALAERQISLLEQIRLNVSSESPNAETLRKQLEALDAIAGMSSEMAKRLGFGLNILDAPSLRSALVDLLKAIDARATPTPVVIPALPADLAGPGGTPGAPVTTTPTAPVPITPAAALIPDYTFGFQGIQYQPTANLAEQIFQDLGMAIGREQRDELQPLIDVLPRVASDSMLTVEELAELTESLRQLVEVLTTALATITTTWRPGSTGEEQDSATARITDTLAHIARLMANIAQSSGGIKAAA